MSHRLENSIGVVSLRKCIIRDEVEELKADLAPFLEDETIQGLILNCEQVAHIDSSGIRLLMVIFRSLKQRQAHLVLCELHPKILEILRMTRLDQFIIIYQTEEEALNSFK